MHRLFTQGTWNADFHESMKPLKGDIVVNGKRGLDGFPGTDLESHLVKKKIARPCVDCPHATPST